MSEPKQLTRRNLGLALIPVLTFGAIAALFAYALGSGDPSKLPSALLGKPVPTASFSPLAGLKRAGNQLPGFDNSNLSEGRVTVVNFWASWCGPCITEQPQIIALAKRSDVTMFGVNYKDKPIDAHRFLSRYGNPFAALGVDPMGRGAIEWGVAGMPETYVVNGRGKIIYKHTGPITAKNLQDDILPVITAAKKDAP